LISSVTIFVCFAPPESVFIVAGIRPEMVEAREQGFSTVWCVPGKKLLHKQKVWTLPQMSCTVIVPLGPR
jgi:hypothetical protein